MVELVGLEQNNLKKNKQDDDVISAGDVQADNGSVVFSLGIAQLSSQHARNGKAFLEEENKKVIYKQKHQRSKPLRDATSMSPNKNNNGGSSICSVMASIASISSPSKSKSLSLYEKLGGAIAIV